MSREEWRPVVGWPYEVSSQGRVRRASHARNGTYIGRVLRPACLSTGYLKVMLTHGPRRKQFSVHRLVAKAFLPGPAKDHVNHIDSNPQNNRLDNLEWATPSENQRHAFRSGRKSNAGEDSPRATITWEQVREIRERVRRGTETYTSIASDYGVSRQTIGDIAAGRSWKELAR